MASTGKCEYCGATLLSTDRQCPQCGAPNPNYVEPMERTVFLPKTIEELKEYCAERGMPLLRMRFFIGENFQEPKAFGIYKDGDEYVVYKNKANGQRAVRYRGPDEAYAVNELFEKLLEECHNRGIYPDGKPTGEEKPSNKKSFLKKLIIVYLVIFLGAFGGSALYSHFTHQHDGYYQVNENIYYHYGNDWYADSGYGWYELDSEPVADYEDYYVGSDYDSDWGVSDFKQSDTYQEIRESHSSDSSDYDSWDSSDTDWDSDW